MDNLLVFIQQEIILVLALTALVVLFLRKESASGGAKLSLSEVIKAMNTDDAVLIDVRDAKEFKSGHVANAINIPHGKVTDSLSQFDQYRDKQIIVTDTMGQHAATVSRSLAKNGFQVARMRGGMAEWKQDGLPVVK